MVERGVLMNSDKVREIQQELYEIKNMLGSKNKATEDAMFTYNAGLKHYQKRLDDNDIPSSMSFKEYLQKAKEVSLKPIDGKNVLAYKYRGGRVAKFDGSWFVSYVGGSGGTLVTAFPLRRGRSRFFELMRRDGGELITPR